MDELKTETSAAKAEKPKKLKRHFIIWVILIAIGLMFVGGLIGEIITISLLSVLDAKDTLSDGVYFALVNYLPFIGVESLVILYCALAEKNTFHSLTHAAKGGGKGNTWKLFGIGLLAGIVTNVACIVVAAIHGDLHFSVGRFETGYMLLAFFVVLIQAGAEELLTRGYIFGALKERYSVWIAVAANSLLYGALHLMNDGATVFSIINIVIYGAALSIVMVYFDSIWYCIAMHTAWNFSQNFLFGLPNSGLVSEKSFLHLSSAADSIFYDAAFGVEGGIVTTAVLVVMSVVVIICAKKKA